jgi:hypothetical protein
MAQSPRVQPDVLAEVDHVLAKAPEDLPLWTTPDGSDSHVREYVPDYATLRALLAVPIKSGHAQEQESGRVAKSLDAYVAYEMRRAGFEPDGVFPRARQPRVLVPPLAAVEEAVERLMAARDEWEAKSGHQLPRDVRPAITAVRNAVRGSADATILGRFYPKQVDAVVLTDWHRGPDVLVSGKTMFSSYLNNLNNRYEEALGEAHNLRDRYPLTGIGFAYVVRSNVFEEHAFELIRDQLVRLRKPDGPFDATMLLVADWDSDSLELASIEDPAPALGLPRFFTDLIIAVLSNTPVSVHQKVRELKLGEPAGGFPPDV